MVVIKEGDDIAIMTGGRMIVMRGVKLSSVSSQNGEAQFLTLRSETRQAKIRRSCLKCGYIWEGTVPLQKEPRTCYNLSCGPAELGRIEVVS